jgi:aminomethyltransferase
MNETKLKRTAIFSSHVRLGAKIVPFAGFEMPVQYRSIKEEHLSVRRDVGIFDVSHMGEIIVKGRDARKYVQKLITNDVEKVPPGRAVYSPVCLESGGIVDDLIIYKVSDEEFFICVNASNTEKDYRHFLSVKDDFECSVENRSDEWTQIAVQGPKSFELLSRIFPADKITMKPFNFIFVDYKGSKCIAATTGYTGEKGCEIYLPNNAGSALWNELLEKGKDLGVSPTGLGARDTLRLEMKYCLYGNDIDETTTPIEAGLDWTVKFDKEGFIGKDVLLEQKRKGVSRKLTGFRIVDKGIPRHGYTILDISGEKKIGIVTSGTLSPSLGYPVGLGYISTEFSAVGIDIVIDLKGIKNAKAVIVETPFYKRGY